MIYQGNLTIPSENAKDLDALEAVTGNLHIDADVSLPVLASVGGHLYTNAKASLPVLASVGGHLYSSD
jgi:hypothetical protein